VRIYLISPTHYLPDGSLAKHPHYWTSGITLPYLAALTPPEHEVSYVDEIIADVDLEAETDVVGLTAMGPQIARAYDLADDFRRRGRKVVLGGSWVSLTPAEALAHADADLVLMSAAVADYRPARPGDGKRPKSDTPWQVELEPTEDVVKALAARRENGQVIVAFGAEQGESGLQRKRAMLADKNVDLVVYNDVSRTDIGFDSKDNEVVLITRDGEKRVAKAPKSRIAAAVLDEAVALLDVD